MQQAQVYEKHMVYHKIQYSTYPFTLVSRKCNNHDAKYFNTFKTMSNYGNSCTPTILTSQHQCITSN